MIRKIAEVMGEIDREKIAADVMELISDDGSTISTK